MNRKILLIALIAIVAIVGASAYFFSDQLTDSSINIDASALTESGSLIVDGENLNKTSGLFHTETSDNNTVLVKNGGSLKLTDSIVNKTGSTQTTGDDADFYGVNSAVLINTNGTLDIKNVEINTNSNGSNGIFVTNSNGSGNDMQGGGQPPEAMGGSGQGQGMSAGDGAQGQGNGAQPGQSTTPGTTHATIKNVKITTHADKSRGLDATYNGKITADNVIINTDGQSCAALATDRGDGEVHVKKSEINTGVSKTSGRGSPLIYSTGNITLENTKGTAYVSQIACIEGKNSIEMNYCNLTGYAQGNRQDEEGNYVDLGGIFIYQSMSGDADVGKSLFISKDSHLSIAGDSPVYKTAPMFHVTNTACTINLENTELNFGSGVFLEASGQNQWGNTGSNGGACELNTTNQIISGKVTVDEISSLNWTMEKTNFTGSINSTGNTTVVVKDGSTWTLTGDSNVTALKAPGNIEYGEYTLTINGQPFTKSYPYQG